MPHIASKSTPTMLNIFLISWISISLNNIHSTRSLIEIMSRWVIHALKIYPVLFHLTIKSYWTAVQDTSNHATAEKEKWIPIKWAVPSAGHCIQMYRININESRQNLSKNGWRRFKKRYNIHTNSFRHNWYSKETTLSKFIWEIKKGYNEMPTLKWSIVKSVPPYSKFKYIKKNAYYVFSKNLKLLILKTKIPC